MMTTLEPINENYQRCISLIHESAFRAHRSPDDIKLIVVTKGQNAEKIKEVVSAGAHLLGENYPEETLKKIPLLGELEVQWQMIGHIQSRKIKILTEYFSSIQSIESLVTAEKVNRKFLEKGRIIPVLYEVNVSGEKSKQGFLAADKNDWPLLAEQFSTLITLSNLKCTGLMTMPPISANPEDSRIYFRKLKDFSNYLAGQLGKDNFSELSMGTSIDFGVAVEEGATFVRVGESIMGPREYKNYKEI